MRRKFLLGLAVLAFILIGAYLSTSRDVGELELVAENLVVPWSIDFLPDGSMIFTERPGRVSLLDNGNIINVANISVVEESESGLHGVAVDPQFVLNRFVYLYYTHQTGNRVSRFVMNEVLENETILIDNIPNARFHDGGRIKFSPDGLLYITTGDATVPSTAQDLNSTAGKILRMNRNGNVEVYSYGHRNSQGITWSNDGVMYSSEHGPSANDEINIIEKGQNYGWPAQCTDQDNHTKPIRCFTEFTLAPSGILYHKGALYVAGLRGAQLRKLALSADGKSIVSEEIVIEGIGRIRDVVAHDGWLYIATNNRDGRGVPRQGDDRILRIKI